MVLVFYGPTSWEDKTVEIKGISIDTDDAGRACDVIITADKDTLDYIADNFCELGYNSVELMHEYFDSEKKVMLKVPTGVCEGLYGRLKPFRVEGLF